jgi:thiol-disulfide isomerase/thioredoxin
MRWRCFIGKARFPAGLVASLGLSALAAAQDVEKRPGASAPRISQTSRSDENLKSINDEFDQQSLLLERRRLERLERLAARQNRTDAAATYEHLFRLAINNNLFRDAEQAAKTVISGGSPSQTVTTLAHIVKIIAESDRGAYEQSLESLRQAITERENSARGKNSRIDLSTGEIVEVCDAYYQRLIQGAQYEKARKALKILLEYTKRPVVREFLSSRLRRLDMVGKPAPAIQGTDFDGKAFSLGDAKGKVVLVVFWASWCTPCAEEIEPFQQVAETYRGRGFLIVGIDLDAMRGSDVKLETALPNIRRFLLDHDVRWPTLISGQGDRDYARAFGVTEIPANVLIAKDGTIADIDLVRKNLDSAVARAVGE